MRPSSEQMLSLHDLAPVHASFRDEVLHGLSQTRKRLPCKFLYDEHGSRLFDQICQLDEYYPTRTELAIMRRHADEMAALIGSDCLLIEYGSGSSHKTRVLLDHLSQPAGYVPIDISRACLLRAARDLTAVYPHLPVLPICADYTAGFSLPAIASHAAQKTVYFPGSTIGNFEPHEAHDFLLRIRNLCGRGSGLLIGVDLKKDPRLLHAAYNDAAGVTAEFNLNLLTRINRELNGDFSLECFAHYAFYNARHGRIEMHLVSLTDQLVHAAHEPIAFSEGESIFTESSYKYTVDEFAQLATDSGYRLQQVWRDEHRLFSVQYLTAC